MSTPHFGLPPPFWPTTPKFGLHHPLWLANPTLKDCPNVFGLPPPIYNFIISFQIATDAGVNLARIKSLNYPDPFLDLIFDSIIRKSSH